MEHSQRAYNVMADLQMSQTGTFFWKIGLFDVTSFDIAPLTDSDGEAGVLDWSRFCPWRSSASFDTLHSASAWLFRAKALLEQRNLPKRRRKCYIPDKIARTNAFAFASVIKCVCSDFARQYFGSITVDGDEHIQLVFLERWLPMNHCVVQNKSWIIASESWIIASRINHESQCSE